MTDLLYKPNAVALIQLHQLKTHEWWALPEVIDAFAAYVDTHPICALCRRPSQVPHHNDQDDYLTLRRYLDALQTSRVFPVCHSCHEKIHAGWTLCPTCSSSLVKPGFEECYQCHLQREEKESPNTVIRTVRCPHCLETMETSATNQARCQNKKCRRWFTNPGKHEVRLR
jgi:hypothetical protein